MGSFPFSLPGKKGLQPCWKRPDHDVKKGIKTRTRSQVIRGKTKIKCFRFLPFFVYLLLFQRRNVYVVYEATRLGCLQRMVWECLLEGPNRGWRTLPFRWNSVGLRLLYYHIPDINNLYDIFHLVDSNTDDSLPMTGIYLVQDGWPLTGTVPSYVYNST